MHVRIKSQTTRERTLMKIVHSTINGVAPNRTQPSRTFAHHYGSVKRHAAPERALRVFPPLGWGVGNVLPHVRRRMRADVADRAIEVAARIPLAL
jgi:hypothetical protein